MRVVYGEIIVSIAQVGFVLGGLQLCFLPPRFPRLLRPFLTRQRSKVCRIFHTLSGNLQSLSSGPGLNCKISERDK